MLIGEVAREARVSVSSVRHWLLTGKLPYVRPGRRVMVLREDFERFLGEPHIVPAVQSFEGANVGGNRV